MQVQGQLAYRIIMTEPVLQGLATPHTRYIVAPPSTYAERRSSVSEEDDDDIDISEAFLATSLIRPAPPSLLPNTVLQTNGDDHSPLAAPDAPEHPPAAAPALVASPLTYSPDRSLLHPAPPEDEDDLARVVMSAADLARFGLLSGAWVELRGRGSRAVRVFAMPSGHIGTSECAFYPIVKWWR